MDARSNKFYHLRGTAWCWSSRVSSTIACHHSSTSMLSDPKSLGMISAMISAGWGCLGWLYVSAGSAIGDSSSHLSSVLLSINLLLLITLISLAIVQATFCMILEGAMASLDAHVYTFIPSFFKHCLSDLPRGGTTRKVRKSTFPN